MTRLGGPHANVCYPLQEDPELAEAIDADRREATAELLGEGDVLRSLRGEPPTSPLTHMLFWHLAGRWGRVRSDGLVIALRLTHTTLAELVAARRPTVTSALTDLARRSVLRPVDNGWLLSGEPPSEVSRLRDGPKYEGGEGGPADPLIAHDEAATQDAAN